MKPGDLTRHLGVRIAFMLLIALTPVGLVAVWQTSQVIQNTEAARDASLIRELQAVTRKHGQLIQRGFGAAEIIGRSMQRIGADSAACSKIMRDFITVDVVYSYAQYVDPGGMILCASDESRQGFVDSSTIEAMGRNPHYRVDPLEQAGQRLLSFEAPVYEDNRLEGYASLVAFTWSLNFEGLSELPEPPVAVMTFNDRGQLLTLSDETVDVERILPANRGPETLANSRARVLRETAADGRRMVYAVAPVVPGTAFALGVWTADSVSGADHMPVTIPAILFPVLMLLVSLGVAALAMRRLVTRHINRLGWKMRQFASKDRRIVTAPLSNAPAELREMDENFIEMAQKIAYDEAKAENLLREKNVLLKEVHHRVKNNLQLIVSIINMQMRRLYSPEAKFALKSVQDRVMGLALVHSNLYRSTSLSEVRADSLLADMVNQLVVVGVAPGAGVELKMNMEEVVLYPDQAVPFSLLAAEAVTNALKYLGPSRKGEAPWINVDLLNGAETGEVVLSIANSVGPLAREPEENESTGLGAQLIDAFALQLDARVEVEETDDVHRIEIRFEKKPFQEDEAGE